MKKLAIFLISSLVPLFLWAAQAGAQGPMHGSGGWGPDSGYSRNYDVNSVETLSGEVLSVTPFTPGRGMAQGVHVQLKTDEGTLDVHLGPAWFLDRQDTQIEPQDRIEVTGSKIANEGDPYMIAGQIKKGDTVLQLRDEEGYPAWAGWKRGR